MIDPKSVSDFAGAILALLQAVEVGNKVIDHYKKHPRKVREQLARDYTELSGWMRSTAAALVPGPIPPERFEAYFTRMKEAQRAVERQRKLHRGLLRRFSRQWETFVRLVKGGQRKLDADEYDAAYVAAQHDLMLADVASVLSFLMIRSDSLSQEEGEKIANQLDEAASQLDGWAAILVR